MAKRATTASRREQGRHRSRSASLPPGVAMTLTPVLMKLLLTMPLPWLDLDEGGTMQPTQPWSDKGEACEKRALL